MQETIEVQRKYFNRNETKNVSFRIKQLTKLKTVLKANEQLLYDAIYLDFKKSEFDTFTTELSMVYHDIEEALKKVKKWSKTKRVKTNLTNFPAKSYVIPEPLGVTLIIGAWNYPYQLSLAPVVASLAAGNTVILKPSELPANTSKIMAELINSNFAPEYLKVIEGGIPETTELLKQKFDKIFFTGSIPVGKIIYNAASKNLTPVTLELGGKSPAIITKECDLKMTIKRLVWAKFLNSGQTCVAPDYVLVDQSIKENFLTQLKQEIKKSQFSFENGNYVQIINDKNLDRLVSMIDQEKVYSGGAYDKEDRYLEPTILTEVTMDDEIMRDEIFGPILPIISFKHIDEAILKVRSLPKPLSAYIFTNDKNIRTQFLNEVSFGGGAVNDAVMHLTNSKMPFGGVGQSGIGAYHGENGFKTFTHFKSILDKPNWLEFELKYSPHTKSKLNWIKRLM